MSEVFWNLFVITVAILAARLLYLAGLFLYRYFITGRAFGLSDLSYPGFAWTRDAQIFVKYNKCFPIAFRDICEIRYHYHAAIGFVAWLEFVLSNGQSCKVDALLPGIKDDVIPALEKYLTNFYAQTIEQCIQQGDVEDSCVIWKQA